MDDEFEFGSYQSAEIDVFRDPKPMKPPDIKALEAEVARLREINNRLRSDLYKANRRAEARLGTSECPWDLPNDPRADIDPGTPCIVCGMLGTMDAEDKCIGPPRGL